MKKFKIEVSSVPDRDRLVAEIWYEEKLIAEINQECDVLTIEFYPFQRLEFDYHEFIRILEAAKNKLQ